ncbi:sugar porter family MFS transporter [Vibrio sp. S4M6]|uniref:sugar porter family MFS transporter n=1 Tax=Vibrio sinus TaxID=2946865 RepID=UPI00202A4E0F|nr:sugar porter family MFS transporter [Vibrio sinus]MCL9780005.1 sugar porter family MFS transporter [Vibrio sinus]
MKKSTNLLLITMVAALGGLLFGYDTAVVAGAAESLQVYFHLTPAELGFGASSALIGCVIGAIIAGGLSTKYGRKGTLLMAAGAFFVSAVGAAMPFSFESFVFFRIVGGVGVGIASMVSPMFIAEIAPPNKRGALVSCNQFAIIFGMLLIYFVNYGIALIGNDVWLNTVGWRWMFASGVVPAALFFILLLFIPDTPRWLAMKGRDKEAKELLRQINKGEPIDEQWQEIEQSLLSANKKAVSIRQTGLTGVLLIGIALSVFQQITGINVFLYYAPVIFKSLTSSGTDVAMFETILVGAVNLLFTVIAIFTVDKFGRKPLMIVGAAVMSISMFAIGTAAYLDAVGGYLVVFVLGYIAAFALSLGPVTWVLLSEIFPNKVRSKALSIAVFAQWVANYLVSQTFPMMNSKSSYLYQAYHGGFPFWLYGLFGVVTIVFVVKWVPETKGKSLEELEQIWDKPPGSTHPAYTASHIK